MNQVYLLLGIAFLIHWRLGAAILLMLGLGTNLAEIVEKVRLLLKI